MCGICGHYTFGKSTIDEQILQEATLQLNKRGPDFQSFFQNDFVGLGHARLSIIDTSPSGHQPFWDHTGNYAIIFNGEIFNYPTLKSALAPFNIPFKSSSDTEVLLYQYIHFGESMLNQLNGFFAFAIYNKQENSLFIARDRLGIKPLVYTQNDAGFFFASEMKSLLAFPIQKTIDRNSLALYFQLNYIPAPYSIFKDVQKLEPGHAIFIAQDKITVKKWYHLPYTPGQTVFTSESYAHQQQELEQILDDAVKSRLIADVPLGAFLSGGIDSSVIVGLASRHTQHLNTFSIGFEDAGFFDETPYANLVAKHFNTNHTVFKLKNDDLLHSLHGIFDYIDEPFADSSALLVNLLSEQTRKHVTVALSGDGGDELFAGYNKHFGELKMRQNGLDAKFVSSLLPLWKMLPKSRNGKWSNTIRQLQRFAEGMRLSPAERYWRLCTFLSEQQVATLLSETFDQHEQLIRKNRYSGFIHENGTLNDTLLADVQLVLQGDMLTKVDMMSMANSLEVRVPFLDYRVLEFAFSLPVSSKIDQYLKKKIVQDTFRNMLPPELYNRPKKGFEVPLLPWFKKELKSLITDDLLSDQYIQEQGLFHPEFVKKTIRQLFSNNPGDTHAVVWALLVFQNWYRKYIS